MIKMVNRVLSLLMPRRAGRQLIILAALPAVAAFVACSAATPVPPPTATFVPPPTPTATPTAQEVYAEASGETFALLEELLEELGLRVSGSDQERKAAENLKARYGSMGYDTEIQPFAVQYFDYGRWVQSGGENTAVVVESTEEMRFSGLPLTNMPDGSPSSGPLIALDLGQGGNLPEDGVEGKVVHILTEDIKLNDLQVMQGLQDQVNSLAADGAVAAVFSRKHGEPTGFRPLYGVESPIPALFLSQTDGEQLHELLTEEGGVALSVKIDVEEVESQNVIAELKGAGDDVVVVGAHYDIASDGGIGANDNGSGTAVILSVAEALSGESLPFTLRFISFSAEEVGLLGSYYYFSSLSDAEVGRIKAMLNVDVPGSGEYTAMSGDEELTRAAVRLAARLGVAAKAEPIPTGATSDHEPFELAGVPVLVLWAPDISRINSPEDNLEFVQPERLGGAVLIAKALLQSEEFAQ